MTALAPSQLAWCAAHIPGFVDMRAKLEREGDTRHLTPANKMARCYLNGEMNRVVAEIRAIAERCSK